MILTQLNTYVTIKLDIDGMGPLTTHTDVAMV